MKKVLFATTALVASAGIAAADVATTGSAEMGIVGGSGNPAATQGLNQLRFHQDIEVTFSMSGETGNGLSFGASVQLDEGGTGGAGTDTDDDAGYSVYIKGDFGNLTMGDTDGAFDFALTEVALAGGSLNDAETGHAGYNGNSGLDGNYDGQVVRYDHSVGDFSFAVSVEADDDNIPATANDGNVGDPIFGIGVKYSGDLGGTTVGVGLGYQTGGPGANSEAVGLSLNASMDNGLSLGLNYSDVNDNGSDFTHVGIGLGYTMDALAVGINYGQFDHSATSTGMDADGFGLAVAYDLGGGAAIQFGYGTGTVTGASSIDSYSLGVSMSF